MTDKELDEYIDKLKEYTAMCMDLDWIREYIKMNCPENSEGRDYILAMLETWRISMKDEQDKENELTKPFDIAEAVIQACPDKEWLEEVIFFLVSYSNTLDILDNEEEESEE